MNEDTFENCGDVAGRKHKFYIEPKGIWIPDEGSYQTWGICKNEGCKYSAWLMLSPCPTLTKTQID